MIKFSRDISILLVTVPIWVGQLHSEELTSAPSQNEKTGQILGGWGDRLFSIFGSAIENEHLERQNLIDKLAGDDGQLTNDELNQFLKDQSELEANENERALKQLKEMYDPENGVFSGMYKYKYRQKLNTDKNDQAEKLDERIATILSNLNKANTNVSILQLRSIHWIPIGDDQIDTEMSNKYKSIVDDLIAEIIVIEKN